MKLFYSVIFAFVLLLATAAETASAQTGSPAGGSGSSGVRTMVNSDRGILPVIPAILEPVITGGLLDGVLVRNKPFSAVLDARTIKKQSDGSMKTTRQIITKLWRDSAGRVRREQIVYLNGATPAPNDTAETVSIYDPVALWSYTLRPATQTAVKFKLPPSLVPSQIFNSQTPLVTRVLRSEPMPDGTSTTTVYTLAPPQIIPLGNQQIAGVSAAGWRTTVSVPAGALGNAAPIETKYEAWIALDLQLLVKCSVTNPLDGEQTLTTTSISRSEPQSSMFAVPANYAVSEMGKIRTDVAPPH